MRPSLLVPVIELVLVACQPSTSQLSASVDYTQADLLAEDVFGQVVESETQQKFINKVTAGLNTSPSDFQTVALSNIPDGDYIIGDRMYHNVLASAKHAPRIAQNMAQFSRQFPHLKGMFQKYHVATDTKVTKQELINYFRFAADFLEMRGFNGGIDEVIQKYEFIDLIKIMRTGIFVTQLPEIVKLNGGKTFALVAQYGSAFSSGLSSGVGAGIAAAGAAYGAMTTEVTGRTSMGNQDPVQCRMADGSAMQYTGDEEINGMPIAGVDGGTLGTNQDGVTTSMCGKCATIKGIKFIIVDRIWENDGNGGKRYSDKSQADSKGSSIGTGHTQFDIAKNKFYGNFGGNNASGASVQIGSCN